MLTTLFVVAFSTFTASADEVDCTNVSLETIEQADEQAVAFFMDMEDQRLFALERQINDASGCFNQLPRSARASVHGMRAVIQFVKSPEDINAISARLKAAQLTSANYRLPTLPPRHVLRKYEQEAVLYEGEVDLTINQETP